MKLLRKVLAYFHKIFGSLIGDVRDEHDEEMRKRIKLNTKRKNDYL